MKIFPTLERRKEIKEKIYEMAFLLCVVEVIVVCLFAAGCYCDIIKAEGEKLIIPVSAHEKEPISALDENGQDVVKKDRNKDVEEIADIIYTLESSKGKNDAKCERIGKHNGYGYSQGVDRNFCLSSDEEMRKVVIEWIKDKKRKGMSKKELMCLYSGNNYTICQK